MEKFGFSLIVRDIKKLTKRIALLLCKYLYKIISWHLTYLASIL